MNQPGHILMNGYLIVDNLEVDLSERSNCETIYFAPFENVASDMKDIKIVGKVNIKKTSS